MSITVYIAAPYPQREEALRVKRQLEVGKIHVRAAWLSDEEQTDNLVLYPYYAQWCVDDVRACDLLIALNDDEWTNAGTGGRHIEFGIAIALGKPIVLVGDRSNIFHHLSYVLVIDSTADIVKCCQKVVRK